jgi:hypothetical protein
MSAIFEWAEPPVKNRNPVGRKSTFGESLAALREFPDKWARVTEQPLDGSKAASHAARIRNGLVTDVAAGEFDASDGDGHLFIKYVGDDGIKAWAEAKAERDAAKARKTAATGAEGGSSAEAAPAADGDSGAVSEGASVTALGDDESDEYVAEHEAPETPDALFGDVPAAPELAPEHAHAPHQW